MSSPVGHIVGALAVYRALEARAPSDAPRAWKGWALVAVLAFAPDLDVVWGWIWGDATQYHRAFTHSILFALILAFLGNLAWYGLVSCFERWRYVWVLLVACLVHPLLDMLMKLGRDIPLFAPFSWEGYSSPVQLVPTAYYTNSWSGVRGLLTDWRTWQGVLLEVWIFVPLLLAASPGRRWSVRFGLVLLTAAAVVTTYFIYR